MIMIIHQLGLNKILQNFHKEPFGSFFIYYTEVKYMSLKVIIDSGHPSLYKPNVISMSCSK